MPRSNLKSSQNRKAVQTGFKSLQRLPRFERDGVTHARACECPRCEAGFQPSEQQRAQAEDEWRRARARERAAQLAARQTAKREAQAMKLLLELDTEARSTSRRLLREDRSRERAQADGQLQELLRLRAAGVPYAEAMARVEGGHLRCPPRTKAPQLKALSLAKS